MRREILGLILMPIGFFGSIANLIAYSAGERPLLGWIGAVGIIGIYLWFYNGESNGGEPHVKKRDKFKEAACKAKKVLDQGRTQLQKEMEEFREWLNRKQETK